MQDWSSPTVVVETLLADLLQLIDSGIQYAQVKRFMSPSLRDGFMFLLENSLISAGVDIPIRELRGMLEDSLGGVPHLKKDSLMPKDVTKQQKIHQLQNHSTITFTSRGLKKSLISSKNDLSLSTRPPQSLIVSNRQSITLTNRRFPKNDKSIDSKLQCLKQRIQIDDPEIERLRGRTQMRLQSQLQYRKIILQHQNSFKEKSQLLSSFIEVQPNSTITHDYDGQQMKAVQDDDKIKHYSMRVGIGSTSKRNKDSNKSDLLPQGSTIEVNKSPKERQTSRSLKQMQMPLFPQQRQQPYKMEGFHSYRLDQYKKHFARGYSRIDQINKTIQFISTKEQDDPFAEKKHLKDSLDLSLLRNSQLKGSRVMRRLALPKLHGRYKVLDRYQQP